MPPKCVNHDFALILLINCSLVIAPPSTHPDFASLVDPIFAFGRKRVVGGKPSLLLAAERVVERSDDWVSQ
ncbi:MAG: hypothetical protein EOP47_00475 [Sphingobacteriaceae bacterium]|nr:MAG: hypothetical protein EOP47_00475 [Sphingobacteriaceae bacterium]